MKRTLIINELSDATHYLMKEYKRAIGSASVAFLKWDSDIIGFKIGRVKDLSIPSDVHAGRLFLKNIIADCKRAGYKHLHCRIPLKGLKALNLLTHAGFSVADIQPTLVADKLIKKQLVELRGIRVRKACVRDIVNFGSLVKGVFTDTRFMNDLRYPRGRVDALYNEWLKNSISNSHHTVFLAEEKKSGRQAGFVICEIDRFRPSSRYGAINLIAVKKEYRNKGIGKMLTRYVLNWFCGKVDRVEVRTQVSNIPAIMTFIKSGFEEFTEGTVLPAGTSLHYWF